MIYSWAAYHGQSNGQMMARWCLAIGSTTSQDLGFVRSDGGSAMDDGGGVGALQGVIGLCAARDQPDPGNLTSRWRAASIHATRCISLINAYSMIER